MRSNKIIQYIFFALVCLILTSPLWVFKDLLFPYVTSKAIFLRIAVELALPFYIFLILSRKNLRPDWKNWLNIAIVGFVLSTWVSAFFGVNLARSLWGNFERMGGAFYVTHLALLYFYILLLGQLSGRYFKWTLQFFLLVAGIIGLNGVSGWLGGPILTPDPSLPGRASSTLGNPIYLGAFALLPIFISLFFVLQSEKVWKKILYALLALAFFLAMVQSGTRGAMVGFLGGLGLALLYYALLHPSRRMKIAGLSVFLILGILAGLLFMNNQKLPAGSAIRRIFQLKDSNTQARLIQWQSALKGFKDNAVLGVGPENYYIISNRYYDSKLYAFDRSWFDKPHNYLLEVLVTAGVVGFVFYAGMLISVAALLFLAFKQSVITLAESAVLLAGFIAYLIQNLFVFDTVPTSVAFYVFLAFVCYMSFALKNRPINKNNAGLPENFVWTVFMVSFFVSIYGIYVGNWVPLRAAKNVNYAYAYAGADPYKAANYFDTALSLPYIFDLSETASKYSDYATSLVRGPLAAKDSKFVDTRLNKALELQKNAAEKAPNDPVVLQKLENLYLHLAFYHKTPLPAEAIEISQAAIDLAPNRVEARLGLAQLRMFQGFLPEAIKLLEEASKLDPTGKDTRWQLVLAYHAAGRDAEAARLADSFFTADYTPINPGDLAWLTEYFTKENNPKAVYIAEKNVQAANTPVNTALLYKTYIKFGEAQKAQKLIEAYKKAHPDSVPELRKLLLP